MRGYLQCLAAGLLAIPLLAGTRSGGTVLAKPSEEATCGAFGTAIQFEKSPSAAARKALQEEKLVMVLHVSGDFENPEFT